ncbi:MAG: fumarylacetoacetate hydrolase family protein [Anaerovoracaceae bacterium]|nr:fumarylacetoacetate hydrolase family protein [Anaerovoracaceae bacterium]
MKLVTYNGKNGRGAGVVTPDGLGVINAGEVTGKDFPDVLSVIRNADGSDLAKIRSAAGSAEKLSGVALMPPIEKPVHDVICVGVNYMAHREETATIREEKFDQPDPIFFGKRAVRIIGDGEDVEFNEALDPELDYEAELAVIIGKTCRDVAPEDAESVIFGYSVFNDLSSRTLQRKHVQWLHGKSLDTYTAMGPWIVTKDEISFPPSLRIMCRVNGETRQDSDTSLLINDIPALISTISQNTTLEPGDIIATGTPGGVAMAMEPPRYMTHGDKVECEIEGIGTLTNYIK